MFQVSNKWLPIGIGVFRSNLPRPTLKHPSFLVLRTFHHTSHSFSVSPITTRACSSTSVRSALRFVSSSSQSLFLQHALFSLFFNLCLFRVARRLDDIASSFKATRAHPPSFFPVSYPSFTLVSPRRSLALFSVFFRLFFALETSCNPVRPSSFTLASPPR